MSFVGPDKLFTETSAAYHEVGHFVIAHEVGLPQQECRIFFEPHLNRWHGEIVTIDLGFLENLMNSRKHALIAVAGYLSQARYIAELEYGSKVRIKGASDTKLLDAFLTSSRTEDSPGELDLEFGDSTERHLQLTFDGRMFSSMDARSLRQAMSASTELTTAQIEKDVVNLINRSEVWDWIERVAGALIASSDIGGGRKSISIDRIAKLR